MKREEFFQNCDVVVKIPTTCFLLGSEKDFNCQIISLPLYTYMGVENCDRGETLFLSVPYNLHLTEIDLDEMDSSMLEDNNSEKTLLILCRDKMVLDKFKKHYQIDTGIIKKFLNKKLKVWSEVPPISCFNKNLELGLSTLFLHICKYIAIDSLNRNIDNFRSKYKSAQIPDLIIEGSNEEKEWRDLKQKAISEIKELFLVRLLFRKSWPIPLFTTNLASDFCATLGINDGVLKYHIPHPKKTRNKRTYSDFYMGSVLYKKVPILPDYFDEVDFNLLSKNQENYFRYFQHILNNTSEEILLAKKKVDPFFNSLDYNDKSEILISSWSKESFLTSFFQNTITKDLIKQSFKMRFPDRNKYNFIVNSYDTELFEVNITDETIFPKKNKVTSEKEDFKLSEFQDVDIVTILAKDYIWQLYEKFVNSDNCYVYYRSNYYNGMRQFYLDKRKYEGLTIIKNV
jgi:hypothetical protein